MESASENEKNKKQKDIEDGQSPVRTSIFILSIFSRGTFWLF